MGELEKISVVICTYNRVDFIGRALDSMAKQTAAKDQFEVLIINNNCSDSTESVVADFISKNPELDMQQISETNQGLSFARNRGIAECKYDIVTYMDDDGIAQEDFVEQLQSFFTEHPDIAGVGGKVIPIYHNHSEPKWLNPMLRMMVTEFDFGEEIKLCKGKKYPAGCNMSYRKHLLEQVGGFNNALKWRVDDKYIFQEIEKVNDQVFYVPSILVHHHIEPERTTDASFDRLSILLGTEEKHRVLSISKGAYYKKVWEYTWKYFASYLYGLPYILKGQWPKFSYTVRWRRLALLGLIKGE